MINVNDNTILNPDNVVIAEQKGSMYKLTLINGKTLYVNSDVYEDVIAYEPVSKEYVDSKLSGALKRLIVQALPTEDIDINTIYMVLDSGSSHQGNIYNEYMYINSAWELIGTTASSGPAYQAGTNIDITGNVISATDTTYEAGTGINIENNVISLSSAGLVYENCVQISTTNGDVLVYFNTNEQLNSFNVRTILENELSRKRLQAVICPSPLGTPLKINSVVVLPIVVSYFAPSYYIDYLKSDFTIDSLDFQNPSLTVVYSHTIF